MQIIVYVSSQVSVSENRSEGTVVLSKKNRNAQSADLGTDALNTPSLAIHPLLHTAQIRNWQQHDYVIKEEKEVSVRIDSHDTRSTEICYSIDSVNASANETLDYYLLLTGIQKGERVADYYDSGVQRNNGYYFPREGYSTKAYSSQPGFSMLRSNGYCWGWSTFSYPYGKYLRSFPSESRNGFYFDERVRHVTYFLDRQSAFGLIPYTIMPEYLSARTKGAKKGIDEFMFAQTGIWDFECIREISAIAGRDIVKPLYKKLNSISTLYQPGSKVTWTVSLNDSTRWFEYSNLWRSEGIILYVLNTHVTALHLAMLQWKLSEEIGTAAEIDFWERMVRAGINGIKWYIHDPENWRRTATGDGKVLAYQYHGEPSVQYQQFVKDELGEMRRLSQRSRFDDDLNEIIQYLQN
jgi:hypothetical protein